jgi:hypothetical protein
VIYYGYLSGQRRQCREVIAMTGHAFFIGSDKGIRFTFNPVDIVSHYMLPDAMQSTHIMAVLTKPDE